jgi:hypothetical protein
MTKGQESNRSDGAQWLELANGGGVMLRHPTATAVFRVGLTQRRPVRGLLSQFQITSPGISPGLDRSRCADD